MNLVLGVATIRRKVVVTALLIGIVLITVLVSHRRSTHEPVQGGKTVTEWLDSMALVDTTRYDTNNGGIRVGFPQETVSNDPALRALLQIGSDAVPVLMKRVAEPPEPEQIEIWVRLGSWLQQKWQQVRRPGLVAWPPPYPRRQQARKLAAAFTLLALGTNANAGLNRVLEAYASAPAVPPPYVHIIPRGGIHLHRAVAMAMNNLPDRNEEIIADITAGLRHTNAVCREAAAACIPIYADKLRRWKNELAPMYHDELRTWRNELVQLTHDSNEEVRCAALSFFIAAMRYDGEGIQLAEGVLRDRTNSARFRSTAARTLGTSYAKTRDSLPLLYEVLRDPDPDLQRDAREAIRQIEQNR